ncbi:MAG TPA: AMP-binding protein [Acidobacteriota bacterium]|nr:AMP-binding protein [Acidobacteriota bacterium]
MQTLLDLLDQTGPLSGREAIRYFNGYRTWRMSYGHLRQQIASMTAYLRAQGVGRGDKVLLWSENRPEWTASFWACLCRGAVAVPLDFRSSPSFVARIREQTGARILLYGSRVEGAAGQLGARLCLDEVRHLPRARQLDYVPAQPDDIVEIVYTSGTTGEPKGVVHRHRNICSNLRPLQGEIARYRKYARPFQPIRLLDLLPLSHMFGQSLGLFIPILLGGAAVFSDDLHPDSLSGVIRRERVSALVCVPRIAQTLQSHIEQRFRVPEARPHAGGWTGILQRWWRSREIHRALGWKFWALVVGGAEVEASIESFWGRLGYVVVQGYGMTETSPVVAVNHPFHSRAGSIGSVLPGQQVRLSQDGEILVRGDSVVSEYLGAEGEKQTVAEDGWLHTGDLGEFDEEGRLYYRGRKKDLIVTSEGLNVHPGDVEDMLNEMAEVREAVVVARKSQGAELVHAAIIPVQAGADLSQAVQRANSRLESHQRVRSWSVWPDEDFPRTSSTLKVQRRKVAEAVGRQMQGPTTTSPQGSALEQALQRISGQPSSSLRDETSLERHLGLSSLDRIELMAALEEAYRVRLDEERFAQLETVGQLRAWLRSLRAQEDASHPEQEGDFEEAAQAGELGTVAQESGHQSAREGHGKQAAEPETGQEPGPQSSRKDTPPSSRAAERIRFWGWHGPLIKIPRVLADELIVFHLFRKLARMQIEGLEHLRELSPPVILAANHNSHLDTPAVALALPFSWRYRLAPAMAKEHFLPLFAPQRYGLKERAAAAWFYLLARGLFNAYPLPQRMGGVRKTLRRTGLLVERGCCPLIFPEGRRSEDGEMQAFRPGVGVMAMEMKLPVVPVYLQGLFEVYNKHVSRPKAGPVRVCFGSALRFPCLDDPRLAARQVEDAVRSLASQCNS